MKTFKLTLLIAIVLTLFAFAWYGNYRIWRLIHPDAPKWSYWLSK